MVRDDLGSAAIANPHRQNHAVEFVEAGIVQIEQHGGHAKAKKPERSGISCRILELGNRFVHGASVRTKSSITQSQYRLESRAGDASKTGRRIATWLQQRAC